MPVYCSLFLSSIDFKCLPLVLISEAEIEWLAWLISPINPSMLLVTINTFNSHTCLVKVEVKDFVVSSAFLDWFWTSSSLFYSEELDSAACFFVLFWFLIFLLLFVNQAHRGGGGRGCWKRFRAQIFPKEPAPWFYILPQLRLIKNWWFNPFIKMVHPLSGFNFLWPS